MLNKDLIGTCVLEVVFGVSPNKNDLTNTGEPSGSVTLKTDAGTFLVQAVGDCCSTGWIEITEPIPQTPFLVDRMEEFEGGAPDAPRLEGPFDVVVGYRYAIGPLLLDVWNDSNGYYGSNVEVSPQ